MSPKKLSILAVDDEPLILMNIIDILEDLGHEAKGVGSASEGLEQLNSQKFDVLLTDHSMPVMTGSELVRDVIERFPEMGIILASGHSELPINKLETVVRLAKPFTDAELADALDQVRLKS